ncbi:hypothetical protein ES703_75387 [subsurface metagenome]
MVRRESYVLAAFSVHQRKSVKYSEYFTLNGLAKGVTTAMERGADYVSLRRIRPEEAEG